MKKVWTPKMRKAFALKMKRAREAKKPKRGKARVKNPPYRQPKLVLGAVSKRGIKTVMWFDGKHFRTTKIKRKTFATPSLAKSTAMVLLQKFPILRQYHVGVYRI